MYEKFPQNYVSRTRGMSFHALRWDTSLEQHIICLNLQEEERWEVIPGRNNCCFVMRYFVPNLQTGGTKNIFFLLLLSRLVVNADVVTRGTKLGQYFYIFLDLNVSKSQPQWGVEFCRWWLYSDTVSTLIRPHRRVCLFWYRQYTNSTTEMCVYLSLYSWVWYIYISQAYLMKKLQLSFSSFLPE